MDCSQNTDPLKLIREGTSQAQRTSQALSPDSAPVDERTPAHSMVFAQAYSRYLKYYNDSNVAAGDWQQFFSDDVSLQLATASIQDVEQYRIRISEFFGFLNTLDNQGDEPGLKEHLGYLFSSAGTLAKQLDALAEALPKEIALKTGLQNLIQGQLAEGFKRLIAYYKAGDTLNVLTEAVPTPEMRILGGPVSTFLSIITAGLSKNWITNGAPDWATYEAGIAADATVYGSGGSVFAQVNHLATHNLFTSVFDQLLKVYARVVADAKLALENTFTIWDDHAPHYALFLAFLRLREYARHEANTLTQRHLDFYYRDILRLREKPAQPAHAHLLLELAKHVDSYLIGQDELFKAGKDDLGKEAFFANDRDFVANQALVTSLKTIYRHGKEPVGTDANADKQIGRLYASAVANSDDGLGAELTSPDKSWHPFFNKIYVDGKLAEIKMPAAEIGFAIASHYLWMAEGTRTITVDFTVTAGTFPALSDKIICLLTTEKGWLEKPATMFATESGVLRLVVELSGADPPVTPYSADTHGYTFATNLPILLVKLRHQNSDNYIYPLFQDTVVQKIDLKVKVAGLKTLAVSNDFGPVDTSKPFQPFGPSPVAGNAVIIGSKEAFQKNLTSASLDVAWLTTPAAYPSGTVPNITIDFLQAGNWQASGIVAIAVTSGTFIFSNKLDSSVVDAPDLEEDDFYNTASRHGFARLKLAAGFGQSQYQTDLLKYLRKDTGAGDPGNPPVGPSINALSLNYEAAQTILLNSVDKAAFAKRQALFLHVAPFGQAEQHPLLNSAHKVYLVPQFDFQRDNAKQESEAEFYIGLSALQPPQNVALLFQVADGTADPLAQKPEPHVHWSYLRDNEWITFPQNDVEDQTDELLNSGIVTFAVPRDATATNTLLPTEMHWIRAAVSEKSEAVCRLISVAAQALRATFTDRDNDPAFPAKVLPTGTISKLDQPVAAVKSITQPFATFGGRGREASDAFYTRISERLRHKDRAIALWDYEHLVLEAFPQIYKAKCINHLHYEPNDSGTGIYKELAPGHVTVVTLPDLQTQNLRDPLRPYTSLGLLQEIADFLQKRISCFVKLHVKNPQFEEVAVSFKVRFYDGFDEAFYTKKLQESITRFLSPWAFPGSGSRGPSFGGKIYKSVLINFVEEQPYVDYVTDFQLFHDVTGTADREEVEGSRAVSILVSVPAKKHLIQVINPAEEEAHHEKCPCEA
ncbi:baseplate J/gp47 family protein [Hymenobacter jejuensis]|uniref:Uncharacterized protein n=1 Tax=Hymenobacter jejuensis TaxID=2502781 RepID=A0A5B8A4N4_9BACT|nr:baseplate J/gp47 family protein [Hymenobacter jejuensis]QDA61593.1 hypothetical protein FHG12_16480 [Hymenobacter jejuensis]